MKDYPDASNSTIASKIGLPTKEPDIPIHACSSHNVVFPRTCLGYSSIDSLGCSDDTVSLQEKSPPLMSAETHISVNDSTPLSSMESTPLLPSSEYVDLCFNRLSDNAISQSGQPFIEKSQSFFDYRPKQNVSEHEASHVSGNSIHISEKLPDSVKTSENQNVFNPKETQVIRWLDDSNILNISKLKSEESGKDKKGYKIQSNETESQNHIEINSNSVADANEESMRKGMENINITKKNNNLLKTDNTLDKPDHLENIQQTKEAVFTGGPHSSTEHLFLRRSTRIRKPSTFKIEYLEELAGNAKEPPKDEPGDPCLKYESNAEQLNQFAKLSPIIPKEVTTESRTTNSLSNIVSEIAPAQSESDIFAQSMPVDKKDTIKISEIYLKTKQSKKENHRERSEVQINRKIKKKRSTKIKKSQLSNHKNDSETDLSDLDEDPVSSKWTRMIEYDHVEPLSASKISKIQKQKKKFPQFDDSNKPKKRRKSYNLDKFEEGLIKDINQLKKLKTEKSAKQKLIHLEQLENSFELRFELYEQLTNKCKTLHKEIKIMESILFRDVSIPLVNQIKDFRFQMNKTEWKVFDNIVLFSDAYKPISLGRFDQKSCNQITIDDDDSIPMTDIFDLKKIPRNNDSCKFINASTFIAGFKQHYAQFPESHSDKNEIPTIKLCNPFLLGLSETYSLLIPKDDEYNPMFELGRTMAITAITFFPEHLRMQIINYNQPNFSVVGSFAIGLANNDLSVIKTSVASYNHFVSNSIKEIRSYILRKFNRLKKRKPIDETKLLFHNLGRCFMKELLQQVYIRCIPVNINALRQYKAFSNNVYGEILPPLLSKMLKECNARPNNIFLDLGSGVGNCVIQASLEFKCDSYGIEIMKGPLELCETQFEEFKNRANYYGLKYGPIQFYLQESFLDNKKVYDLIPNVDIILVNNYVFDSNLNIKVGLLLNSLKPGAKIIHMKPIDGLGDKNSISSRLKCYEVPFTNGMVSWTHNNGKFFIGEVQKTYLKDAFDIRLQTRSRSKKLGI